MSVTLEQQFEFYAKYGNRGTDGDKITLTNTDMWLKQAKILDHKKVTLTDTGVCFNKTRTRTITYEQFLKFLDDLAAVTNQDILTMKTLLLECGLPGDDEKKPEKTKKEKMILSVILLTYVYF